MKREGARGFTLVEMMLAIVIFSLLSISALMIFKGVLRNSEITQRKSTQMVQLQRTLTVIERDFTHALTRTPAGLAGQPGIPEFVARGAAEGVGDYRVMMIRNYWHNPGARLPRSTLERVEYRFQKGVLERLSFPTLNSPASAVRSVTLLSDVLQFQLRFYYQGEWLTAWHASTWLPQTIEITVETRSFGVVRRIVQLSPEEKS